jgi:peptide/nickel transport system permease protein
MGSRAIVAGSILGFSLPNFWQGLMLVLIFSVTLGWLPAGGRGPTVSVLGVPISFLTLEGLQHLILPALNLALFKLALVIRLARAGTREVVHMDYVKFARAKGLGRGRIIGVHVLKNILIPVVTVLGLEFAGMIAFAVVTETVFAYPGIGKLLIDSINRLDRPVIVAYLMLTVALFILINFVVDVIYSIIDPRVRLAEAKA